MVPRACFLPLHWPCFPFVPSNLTSVTCSHRRPACHCAVALALETPGLISAGWYSLHFQRGRTWESLSPGPPAPWASAAHIPPSVVPGGFFSSCYSLYFHLSLTIHIIPFEKGRRKNMHMETPCSLPRICGFSNRSLASQETPLHKATLQVNH